MYLISSCTRYQVPVSARMYLVPLKLIPWIFICGTQDLQCLADNHPTWSRSYQHAFCNTSLSLMQSQHTWYVRSPVTDPMRWSIGLLLDGHTKNDQLLCHMHTPSRHVIFVRMISISLVGDCRILICACSWLRASYLLPQMLQFSILLGNNHLHRTWQGLVWLEAAPLLTYCLKF